MSFKIIKTLTRPFWQVTNKLGLIGGILLAVSGCLIGGTLVQADNSGGSIFVDGHNTYFGRAPSGGSFRNEHTSVAPRIHDYESEKLNPGNLAFDGSKSYAVDFANMTGNSIDSILGLSKSAASSGGSVSLEVNKAHFFGEVESRLTNAKSLTDDTTVVSSEAWKFYHKFANLPADQNYPHTEYLQANEVTKCVIKELRYQKGKGYNPAKNNDEASTKAIVQPYVKQCSKWLATAYDFVLHSAAGVTSTEARSGSSYASKKAAMLSDDDLVLRIQYMRHGGLLLHPDGKAGVKAELANKVNTGIAAANKPTNQSDPYWTADWNFNDIRNMGPGIKPSYAITMWHKADLEGGSSKIVSPWSLRLDCANPVGGTRSPASDVIAEVEVGVDQPKIKLKKDEKIKVKFNYRIYRKVTGYKKESNTTVDFTFSGRKQDDFKAENVKVTSTEPAGFLNVGSSLPGFVVSIDNKNDQDKDYKGTTARYEEEFEISEADKNWEPTSENGGVVCRKLNSTPNSAHKFKPAHVPNVTKEAEICVVITTAEETEKEKEALYLYGLEPKYNEPTDRVDSQGEVSTDNGLVGYAIRPKQWTKGGPDAFTAQRCETDPEAEKKATKEVSDKCVAVCKDNPDDNINCELTTKVKKGSVCHTSTYVIPPPPGWFPPPPPTYGTKYYYYKVVDGQCSYKKRDSKAKWVYNKFLLKPETTDAEVDIENLDSDEEPEKFYKGKFNVSGWRWDGVVAEGENDFDHTDIYSLNPNSNWKDGSPTKPMYINISPTSPVPGGTPPGFADVLYTTEDLPTGAKVCFGLSVFPWKKGITPEGNAKTEKWAHATPRCFVVMKKPYFAIQNGLAISRGSVLTSYNKRNEPADLIKGSYSEYNMLSGGTISDSFLTNVKPDDAISISAMSSADTLMFANTPGRGNFGQIDDELVDAANFFSGLQDGPYAYTMVTTAGGGDISGGLSGINVYNGDATISGDVTGGTVGQGVFKDIPQAVIVVNGDLTINHGVSQINAWLIVNGTLMTSHLPVTQGQLDQGIGESGVENQLTITGAVSARRIKLRRTYGSGIKTDINSLDNPNDEFEYPAEIFIDNPDTYVWSYYNSIDKGRLQTVYLREVAPRY